MRDPGRVVVIGAGPTGLGAAHRLQELGLPFLLVESAQGPGGLASSVVDERGFTWDLGGHVQFSHYAYYDRVLAALPGEWLVHERESWIRLGERWIPYPFQNNLHRLAPADCARALAGLEAAATAASPREPANFGEWIERSFGPGIAALFLRPYNEKVWGFPVESLDWRWVGERVAVPDLARVQRNVELRRDDVGWGPNNCFLFPLRGGTGWIWQQVAARLPAAQLRFSTTVTEVGLSRRRLRLADGTALGWDALISSVPLDRLCAMADGLEAPARHAASALRHSSVHVVGVGIRGPLPSELARKCWMYFPEPHSPYYRVTVFSNYSPHHVPAGPHWSLMTEVCETPHRPVAHGELGAAVTAALRRDGLLPADAEVVGTWQRREEHGYPTPFLGREDALRTLDAALEAHGVLSRGRFGAWRYEVSNQDHSFMQGVEAVDRLVGLGDEPTLRDSARVNGGALKVRAPQDGHATAKSTGDEASRGQG